jgi:hypothetical protein
LPSFLAAAHGWPAKWKSSRSLFIGKIDTASPKSTGLSASTLHLGHAVAAVDGSPDFAKATSAPSILPAGLLASHHRNRGERIVFHRSKRGKEGKPLCGRFRPGQFDRSRRCALCGDGRLLHHFHFSHARVSGQLRQCIQIGHVACDDSGPVVLPKPDHPARSRHAKKVGGALWAERRHCGRVCLPAMGRCHSRRK